MPDFYEMHFIKGTVILVERYKNLKNSSSQSFLVERWCFKLDDQSLCWNLPFKCPYVCDVPVLLKDGLL